MYSSRLFSDESRSLSILRLSALTKLEWTVFLHYFLHITKTIYLINLKTFSFTSDVDEREKLAEEVSVSPEVVMFKIGVHVIDQKLFLQLFLNLRDDAQVQVHPQGRDLAGLPVFPQPTRNVEQNGLEQEEFKFISGFSAKQ